MSDPAVSVRPRPGLGGVSIVLAMALACGPTAATLNATVMPPDQDRIQRQFLGEIGAIDALLGEGRFFEAVDRAQDALQTLADSPQFLWQVRERLGTALIALERYAEAVPYLEAAIVESAWVPSLHHNLARALAALGRRGRALGEFREAVDLAPADCVLRLDFAQSLLEFSLLDDAAVQIDAASSLCVENLDLDRVKARHALMSGNHEEALAPLRRLHRAEPTREHRRLLAMACSRAGNFEELHRLLIPFWPHSLSSDEQLLVLEADRAQGMSERARSLAMSETPMTGGTALFWGLVSIICLEADHLEAGLAAIDRAIALEPDSVTYRNNRVVLLTRLERHDDARLEWERVIELDPSLDEPSR